MGSTEAPWFRRLVAGVVFLALSGRLSVWLVRMLRIHLNLESAVERLRSSIWF